MQLIDPMPPVMAMSRFEWLTYNEPEGHLDDLVARLCETPGITKGSRIVGLTYKDDTTLARFERLGYTNVYRYEPSADLGLDDPCAGLESIQAAMDAAAAARLADRHGLADILLVRHVLEHAHDPIAFLRAVGALVKPGGRIVFEMPDSRKFIEACDYSFVWEEHIVYLCSRTLAQLVAATGLTLTETLVYPYPLEDSLIGIVANTPLDGARSQAPDEVDMLLAEGRRFATRYPELRQHLHRLLGGWQRAGKRVAVFGAGHLAARFVNLFDLAGLLYCVIDDNPHKQSVLMPGSRLPIRGSGLLAAGDVDICLMALSPESEQKVRAKNQAFVEHGGRFLSVFAQSPQSIYSASAT